MSRGSSWRAKVLGLGLLLAPGVAQAGAPPAATCDELPCSVIRNCSSTGVACGLDDRACAEAARSKDLEVKCEQQCSDGKRLVYCPPDTGRADDSKIVWVLLGVALGIASMGGVLAWLLLRTKKA